MRALHSAPSLMAALIHSGPKKYCDKPEWKDVAPIPHEDGENAVCTIAYSAECK